MAEHGKEVWEARVRLESFAHQLTPSKTFDPEQQRIWDRLQAEYDSAVSHYFLDSAASLPEESLAGPMTSVPAGLFMEEKR
jgi:hypothetical protein